MDTLIIKKLLKKFKCFKGVYSLDNLPYNKSLPLNIIANTDPSYRPGEHWVTISINSNREGLYFDSFGLPPFKQEFIDFLNSKCKNWSYNKIALQHKLSTTCGHYSVLHTIFRCQGLTTCNFISKFSLNKLKNDKLMIDIFGDFPLAKSWLSDLFKNEKY